MELLKDQWAMGHFTDTSNIATALLNANAVGICDACMGILNLDYAAIEGVYNED